MAELGDSQAERFGVPAIVALILVGCLLGCAVSLAVFACFPRTLLAFHRDAEFERLAWRKKLIFQGEMQGDRWRVYADPAANNGQGIQVVTGELFAPIIREAYEDFPRLVLAECADAPVPRKPATIALVLVGAKTYRTFDWVFDGGEGISAAYTRKTSIYVNASGIRYDVAAERPTLRHELAHALSYLHRVTRCVSHEAIYRFGFAKPGL